MCTRPLDCGAAARVVGRADDVVVVAVGVVAGVDIDVVVVVGVVLVRVLVGAFPLLLGSIEVYPPVVVVVEGVLLSAF